jgi:hypothetical protein
VLLCIPGVACSYNVDDASLLLQLPCFIFAVLHVFNWTPYTDSGMLCLWGHGWHAHALIRDLPTLWLGHNPRTPPVDG